MTDWNRVTKPAATWTFWPEPSPRVAPTPWYRHLRSALHRGIEHLAHAMELNYSPALFKRSWSKTRSWWKEKGQGKHTVWKPEGCPELRFAQRAQLENPSG